MFRIYYTAVEYIPCELRKDYISPKVFDNIYQIAMNVPSEEYTIARNVVYDAGCSLGGPPSMFRFKEPDNIKTILNEFNKLHVKQIPKTIPGFIPFKL